MHISVVCLTVLGAVYALPTPNPNYPATGSTDITARDLTGITARNPIPVPIHNSHSYARAVVDKDDNDNNDDDDDDDDGDEDGSPLEKRELTRRARGKNRNRLGENAWAAVESTGRGIKKVGSEGVSLAGKGIQGAGSLAVDGIRGAGSLAGDGIRGTGRGLAKVGNKGLDLTNGAIQGTGRGVKKIANGAWTGLSNAGARVVGDREVSPSKPKSKSKSKAAAAEEEQMVGEED